jgi:hypothetical protein
MWDEDRNVWRDLDTTPASALPAETSQTLQHKLSDAWSRMVYEFLRIRWGQTALREYILWIVIPILVLLLGQILFSRRRRAITADKQGSADVWQGLDSELYQLEKPLRKKGVVRNADEPVARWLERGSQAVASLREEKETVRELVNLHYRYRFDPNGLSDADRERLRQHASRLARQVRKQ